MSDLQKIDFETLYNKLLDKFPNLKTNPVWQNWDWSNESCEQSVVISEVAIELIQWGEKNDWGNVKDLLIEIEAAFVHGTDSVIAYLGTDFTVTVMECKNSVLRAHIKQLMGEKTFEAYQINLRGYREG